MKLAVVVVAAFAIGAAVGTVLSPARRAVAEAHATDSDEATEARHAVPVLGAVELATPDESGPVGPQVDTSEEMAALVKAVADLPAADAASMVAQLSDSEAVSVLKGQSLARASQILDAMPRETAARLSRLLLLARAGT